jgi:hypothetical protein
VNFEDGKSIHVDCMAIAGGWEYALNIQFKPDGIEAKLGIPTQRSSESDKRFWEALDERADIEILRRYPRLLTAPLDKTKTMTVDPLAKDCPAITRYRLYRAIAPPGLTADGDRSLVFLKMLATFSATLVAEAQALWAYAYLNDELDIENSQVHWQAALLNRFGKLRYPYASGAARYPDFIFDSIPYVDMLLRDLGLKFHRHDSFFREAFHAYSVEDYQGLNQEWIKKKTKIIKAVVVTGQ